MVTAIPYKSVRFETEAELSQFLKQNQSKKEILLPGRPSYLPEELANNPIAYLDISKLNQIIEFNQADQVITIQAGMTIQALQNVLSESNLYWPVNARSEADTIAEILSFQDGGCLEHAYGGPRETTLGCSLAVSAGDILAFGGKVVKNVTGYDMTKLVVGSHGSLGQIVRATLRLYAKPKFSKSICLAFSNHKDMLDAAHKLLAASLPFSCLELSDKKELLAKIQGTEEVIAETCAALNQLCAKDKMQQLGGKEEEAIWHKLNVPTNNMEVQANLSLPQMDKLLSHLSSFSGNWQIRPGRKKIKFFVGDLNQAEKLVADLRAFANVQSAKLVVAYPEKKSIYKVEYLPLESPAVAKIKTDIKAAFDPDALFNPFVSL